MKKESRLNEEQRNEVNSWLSALAYLVTKFKENEIQLTDIEWDALKSVMGRIENILCPGLHKEIDIQKTIFFNQFIFPEFSRLQFRNKLIIELNKEIIHLRYSPANAASIIASQVTHMVEWLDEIPISSNEEIDDKKKGRKKNKTKSDIGLPAF